MTRPYNAFTINPSKPRVVLVVPEPKTIPAEFVRAYLSTKAMEILSRKLWP